MTKLEARYVAGEFPVGSLSFDPSNPDDNLVGRYDDLRDKLVRALPAVIYSPARLTA